MFSSIAQRLLEIIHFCTEKGTVHCLPVVSVHRSTNKLWIFNSIFNLWLGAFIRSTLFPRFNPLLSFSFTSSIFSHHSSFLVILSISSPSLGSFNLIYFRESMVVLFSELWKDDEQKVVFDWKDFLSINVHRFLRFEQDTYTFVQYKKRGYSFLTGYIITAMHLLKERFLKIIHKY